MVLNYNKFHASMKRIQPTRPSFLLTFTPLGDTLKSGIKSGWKKEDGMFEREDDARAAIAASFLLGGIVGAGVALLFAPYSGRKMRGKIADLADDAKEYATDYAKKLKEKVA
jgi:hypothetical protein